MPGMWNQLFESEVELGEKVKLSRMLEVCGGLGPIGGVDRWPYIATFTPV